MVFDQGPVPTMPAESVVGDAPSDDGPEPSVSGAVMPATTKASSVLTVTAPRATWLEVGGALLLVLLLCAVTAAFAYCLPVPVAAALVMPATGGKVLSAVGPTYCSVGIAALVRSHTYAAPALAILFACLVQGIVESGGLTLALRVAVQIACDLPDIVCSVMRFLNRIRFRVMVFAFLSSVSFLAASVMSLPGAEGATVPGPIATRAVGALLRSGEAVGMPLNVTCAAHEMVRNQYNLAFLGSVDVGRADSLELAQSLGLPMAYVPCAPAPCMLGDAGHTFTSLRAVCQTLNLGDSGSGVHAVNSTKYAVLGTVVVNTTAIATANGVVMPPTKCTARMKWCLSWTC